MRPPGLSTCWRRFLEPLTVWSLSEAGAAWADFRRHSLPDGLTAVQCFAQSKITTWHRDRARYVACPVSRLLPVAEAPRTTSQLREALDLIRERRARQSFASAYCLARSPGLKGLSR